MASFAVVEAGSKQYRVEPKSIIEIDLLDTAEGKDVVLSRVLALGDGQKVQFGNPVIRGAKVVCENLGIVRGPKEISFKFRKRKSSQRKVGHRQQYARLRVKEIQTAD